MPTYGFIEKFSGKADEFETYLERLEFYFTANELSEIAITEGNENDVRARLTKRKRILLSVLGPDTNSLLRSLCAPAKPADKSFKEITDILKEYFAPRPSEVVCRYKFHTRNRQSGETVTTYMSELRKLAENCNFDTHLQDIRDRLVCGVADERVQRLLLTEKDLTLEKEYTICTVCNPTRVIGITLVTKMAESSTDK
jgi:hypothetical protein